MSNDDLIQKLTEENEMLKKQVLFLQDEMEYNTENQYVCVHQNIGGKSYPLSYVLDKDTNKIIVTVDIGDEDNNRRVSGLICFLLNEECI